MGENIISMTVPNAITIGLMLVVVLTLWGWGTKVYRSRMMSA